jgi:hypothetical protein
MSAATAAPRREVVLYEKKGAIAYVTRRATGRQKHSMKHLGIPTTKNINTH